MARPKKNADVVEDLVTTDETVDETTDETVDTTAETTEDAEKTLDDLVMVTDTEEEKAEDETSADSSDDVTIQSAVKKVKVKVKKGHSCCIGGIWYNLVAGKETNVPEDVKRILASANLLEVM